MQAPLSADPEVDAVLRRALESARRRLLDAPFGREISAIVLGGSAALGEAVGWRERGDLPLGSILSDLDLAVVTRSPIDPTDRQSLEARLLLAGSDDRWPVETRVGWYEEAQLSHQAGTPGVVDLARRGRVLFGPPGFARRFRAPAPGRIPREEAWRLLGNRALELRECGLAPDLDGRGSTGEHPPTPTQWHALAKACTGLWTAWLIQRGGYVCGLRAQLDLLDEQPACETPEPVRAAALAWRTFRLAPRREHLPAAADSTRAFVDGLRALVSSASDSEWQEAWRYLPRERIGLRDQWRRWRCTLRAMPPATRSSLVAAVWRQQWADPSAGAALGTPDSRERALAVMYWLTSDMDAGSAAAWSEAARALGPGVTDGGGTCRSASR